MNQTARESTTPLQQLAADLAAHDPDVLAAEVARLTQENRRLNDLIALYDSVPVGIAQQYMREAREVRDRSPRPAWEANPQEQPA